MRIAVIARFLSAPPDAFHLYVGGLLTSMAEAHPEHTFTWYTDQPVSTAWAFLPVHPLVIGKPAAGIFQKWWWNTFTLPAAVKKFGADILLQADVQIYKKLPTPAVVFANHVANPKKQAALSKILTAFRKVIFFSATPDGQIKEDTANKGLLSHVSIAAPPCYQPLEYEQKEEVKTSYASGCEYFLFDASADDAKSSVLNVLKAFTLFKVRQQTNLKLVLYGRPSDSTIYDELKTYKFREGVRVVDTLPTREHQQLMAAAYAFVFPGNGFPSPIVQAMQSGAPVITSNYPHIREVAGNAILEANMNDPQSIADQMKLLYKDEDFRRKLVLKGAERAATLSWQDELQKVHELISTVVSS